MSILEQVISMWQALAFFVYLLLFWGQGLTIVQAGLKLTILLAQFSASQQALAFLTGKKLPGGLNEVMC
jgi:hypothetical protein